MAKKQERLIVEWTATAEQQLFAVLNYWTEKNQSTTYAEKLVESIWKRTQILSINPYISIQTNLPDTRKSILGHFSIIYKVAETKLTITAFWDNRQNPKKLYDLLKSQ